ncbi:MAG: putative glycosyl hydrolase [Chthonomonadaceae bacterium]|nr:putative glycosyl hydrolase [Chthonomonadaceae bacterium]
MRTPSSLSTLLYLPGLLITAGVGAPSAAQAQGPTIAVRATDFLNSIGANSAIDTRGETLAHTIACAKYLGLRWFRSGPEGGVRPQDIIELHKQTGARVSWGLLSGGADIPKLIETAHELAPTGALLAFEGPNEPNNWGITYKGQTGGKNLSWIPVAQLQSDLYKAVKSDTLLKKYPVFGISEEGAETDNVGLQFLTIPAGANCTMPDGTKYADYANVHNYVYHPNSRGVEDNKTWNASDPGPACKVDGLFGEYGRTWARHYMGYPEKDLVTLPKVTTETGSTIEGPVTEEIHALNLLSLYLDQFKRGWSYTAVYLMRDRSDEGGNQQFGFYKADYTPRKATLYLHNLTTILADNGTLSKPGQLNYSIPNQPATVHDMLLQKSDGTFELVVWGERVQGSDSVTVNLGGAYRGIKVYDPTLGTSETQTLSSATTIPLTLSDHPLILAIPARKGR